MLASRMLIVFVLRCALLQLRHIINGTYLMRNIYYSNMNSLCDCPVILWR